MTILNNTPCMLVTPKNLVHLCNYEWALPIIIENIDKLSLHGWTILHKKSWARVIFTEYADKVPLYFNAMPMP